jgi:hypothetical protein
MDEKYQSKTIIISTGLKEILPGIDNISDYYGTSDLLVLGVHKMFWSYHLLPILVYLFQSRVLSSSSLSHMRTNLALLILDFVFSREVRWYDVHVFPYSSSHLLCSFNLPLIIWPFIHL